MGMPWISAMGLPGKRDDAMRAGMIAIMLRIEGLVGVVVFICYSPFFMLFMREFNVLLSERTFLPPASLKTLSRKGDFWLVLSISWRKDSGSGQNQALTGDQ